MKLHQLESTKGSRKAKHRVGRGHAAGKGKQAGKGQSGQNKRGGTRPGFEGGQNPWYRRLPKRGFNNINHIEYTPVSLSSIDKFKDGQKVTKKDLVSAKIIKSESEKVKILGSGNLTKKINIEVEKASQSAIAAIEKQKGTFKATK